MSVRNYSVKNYSKIAPCPPSSKFQSDARIASKRINDFRTTTYKGKLGVNGDSHDISDIENQYPNKPINLSDEVDSYLGEPLTNTEKPKAIRKIPRNLDRNLLGGQGRDAEKSNRMTVREKGGKELGTGQRTGIEKQTSNKYKSATRDSGEKGYAVGSVMDGSDMTNESNQKPVRPKSARPESRWERRFDIDNDSDSYVKPSRPESARPTSRMMGMMEAQAHDGHSYVKGLPPRPKTSYGKRHSVAEDDAHHVRTDIFDRPKSRLGWESDVLKIDSSGSESDTDIFAKPYSSSVKSKPKDTKPVKNINRFRKSRIKSEGDLKSDPLGSFSNDTPVTFETGSSMYDLNSKIDDIDLDVDPVEYFMQDDNISNRFVSKKPSLSKDTIRYIGSTRKSHLDKAIKGYHGNNHNKHYPKAEISDRRHSNSFQSPQYSVSESNQGLVNQDVPGKINRKTSNAPNYSLANGDAYQSRGVKNALKYSKAEVSRDILAKYTALSSTNGYLTQTSSKTFPGEDFRRKPRKLDPIFQSCTKRS